MCRTLVVAILLAATPARPAERARHPALGPGDASDACESCHADATPSIVKEWESGPHGLVLVKCFVCHGSTGKDFAHRATPQRCAGCHAAQVASVTPARGRATATDCFSCHSPHSLAAREGRQSPHDPK